MTSGEEEGTKDTEGQSYQYSFFLKLSTWCSVILNKFVLFSFKTRIPKLNSVTEIP